MSYGTLSSSLGSRPGFPPEEQAVSMAQPTLLRSKSEFQPNLVDIPVEPVLRANECQVPRQVRLEILTDDVLSLFAVPSRPAWISRLTYFCLIGCLFYMIYGGLQGMLLALERNKTNMVVMWAVFAGLPALILLGTLIYPFFKAGPMQYRFDRSARLMTMQRCYGFSITPRLLATYSLDDVVALQLLYRYFAAFQAGVHPQSEHKHSYEMNLVFRNTLPPRVNLAVHSDWKWMRQAGPRLAEFLDIPVIDQLCQT